LRSEAAARLESRQNWLDPAFELKGDLLGLRVSQDSSYENFNASRHAVELRHPYRDRRLVEFVLSLPAYQLYNLGFYKYILRTAMRGILPEPILSRTQPTSLAPLFSRGLEGEPNVLQACLHEPGAAWREYVRADWMTGYWNGGSPLQMDGPSAVVLWYCVSFDAWLRDFS
jgi:asparagine synthase (glutamine-hydrolysing)